MTFSHDEIVARHHTDIDYLYKQGQFEINVKDTLGTAISGPLLFFSLDSLPLTESSESSEPTSESQKSSSSTDDTETDFTSSDDTQSTTSQTLIASNRTLRPRIPINYNETLLKHLCGRPQIRILNNLSIPLPDSSNKET